MDRPHTTDTDFTPAPWLRNRHVQSCFRTLFPVQAQAPLTWEQLELPDGDFIDLCWAGREHAPIIVLLHGLEGSIDSHYIQIMLDPLVNAGWRVVVMHFRTCSGRLNRLARSYHAGDTRDLSHLIVTLRVRYPDQEIAAMGFSLGANVLLNYLAHNPNAPIQRAAAVSVPFELGKCIKFLSPFYQWNLLRSIKQKMRDKLEAGYKLPVTFRELRFIRNFYQFDDVLTAPLHGFCSGRNYYEKVTVRHFLPNIRHPVLIIHAEDDPFVPRDCVPDRSELPTNVSLVLLKHGGHIGFIEEVSPWRSKHWLKDQVLAFIKKAY